MKQHFLATLFNIRKRSARKAHRHRQRFLRHVIRALPGFPDTLANFFVELLQNNY